MQNELSNYLFCCLTVTQQQQLEAALANGKTAPLYRAQENFTRQKRGYRCSICGRHFPYLQLEHHGALLDPQTLTTPAGDLLRCQKAAAVFRGTHYYAQTRNTLVKYESDPHLRFQQTDIIPLMKGVYHVAISQDERYIATETFSGTLQIIDLPAKNAMAKRQHLKINGAFIFAPDHKLLYYYQEAIHCWDYCNGQDSILWQVPPHWKQSNPLRNIICTNTIYRESDCSCLFVLSAPDKTYLISIINEMPSPIVALSKLPIGCTLVWNEDTKFYTMTTDEHVVLYDANFHAVETFSPPHLLKLHDGGGLFPISRHEIRYPNRTFLSPDGKWLLLDYFTCLILMRREDHSILFCLFSHTGRVAQHMGFSDATHFYYTWGNTTYIQTIDI